MLVSSFKPVIARHIGGQAHGEHLVRGLQPALRVSLDAETAGGDFLF